MSTKKKTLSLIQIFNMSFGFLGIQFGFALQNANVSRIFETLGAHESDIAALWLAAPVTGLLVQPIIGYFSDKTWHPTLGRRRPYFLVGAIIASIALVLMPNSPTLWIAAGLLWVLDASINITMEPFRAFVGDKLNEEQRTKGFAMQSFFIGVGAVIASLLPWIFVNIFHMEVIHEEGVVPINVKWSFYLGAAAYIITVLWTVFTTDEYPPENTRAQRDTSSQVLDKNPPAFYQKTGHTLLGLGALISAILWYFITQPDSVLKQELFVLPGLLIFFGLIYTIAAALKSNNKSHHAIAQIVSDFQHMPRTMTQLAGVQFFTWFALFAMWIYATQATTTHIYHTTSGTALYNEGADWIGFCFGIYNGIAALAALALPTLAAKLGRNATHFICLMMGGIGLISFYFITDPNHIIFSMIGVGIAWASILSMPYAILTSSIPEDKMGYYMGIFNFFIVIPQIVAASILGVLVNTLFQNQTIYALILGGVCMIIAGLLTLSIQNKSTVTAQD